MFEAKSTNWLVPSYSFVTESGLQGRLDIGLFVDQASLELRGTNGQQTRKYRVVRPRLFGTEHEMRNGDAVVASAESGGRLDAWSEIRFRGGSFRLERDGFLRSNLRLLMDGDQCGELRRGSWWRGGVVVDLSPDLPIELRCFVLALAVFRWRAMIPTAVP